MSKNLRLNKKAAVNTVDMKREVSNEVTLSENFASELLKNTKHAKSNKVLKTIKSFDFI